MIAGRCGPPPVRPRGLLAAPRWGSSGCRPAEGDRPEVFTPRPVCIRSALLRLRCPERDQPLCSLRPIALVLVNAHGAFVVVNNKIKMIKRTGCRVRDQVDCFLRISEVFPG